MTKSHTYQWVNGWKMHGPKFEKCARSFQMNGEVCICSYIQDMQHKGCCSIGKLSYNYILDCEHQSINFASCIIYYYNISTLVYKGILRERVR